MRYKVVLPSTYYCESKIQENYVKEIIKQHSDLQPSSIHTGYRVLKIKRIVDLNFMNKLAFVLNLASPKHCDAPENKMFAIVQFEYLA